MRTDGQYKQVPVIWGFTVLLSISLVACNNTNRSTTSIAPCKSEKIGFDMSILDENGRIGPSNGKTTLDYEFCIANNEESKTAVLRINPELQIQEGRGRIGCAKNELLCLGNTGTKDFKNELCALSQLDLVKRIERTYWE